MSSIQDQLESGLQRSVAWVLQRIAADGEPIGGSERNNYYRIPFALGLAGAREPASRVLSWIERHALTDDGDLKPGAPQGLFTQRYASYPLALIAIGAWHLEREDTAISIMNTLKNFQNNDSGGSYAERPEMRTSSRQDFFATAQLGMTALTTGYDDMADGAFQWLSAVYDAQPNLPNHLYTVWDNNGLITEIGDDEDSQFHFLTDFQKPKQAFYNPGIAAAFLARYFMKTGNQKAKTLGHQYLQLHDSASDRQYAYRESKQICKYGWGAALMMLADHNPDLLTVVLRMAKWFLDSQLEDGRWENSPFQDPQPTDQSNLEITVEFVQHLVTLQVALGGYNRNG